MRILTVAAFIMTQTVFPSEQVQGGVQVRVYLMDAVPYGFQSHSPVRGFRFAMVMIAGTQAAHEPEGKQQGEDGYEDVVHDQPAAVPMN